MPSRSSERRHCPRSYSSQWQISTDTPGRGLWPSMLVDRVDILCSSFSTPHSAPVLWPIKPSLCCAPDESYQIIAYVTVTFLFSGYPLLVTLAFNFITVRFHPVLPRHTLCSSQLSLGPTCHGHCWVHLSVHVVAAMWNAYLELTVEILLSVWCSLGPVFTVLDC